MPDAFDAGDVADLRRAYVYLRGSSVGRRISITSLAGVAALIVLRTVGLGPAANYAGLIFVVVFANAGIVGGAVVWRYRRFWHADRRLSHRLLWSGPASPDQRVTRTLSRGLLRHWLTGQDPSWL